MPRCLWHFVKHPECIARFGMISSLHCELGLLTKPPCPLIFPLSLTLSCCLPTSPERSGVPWHFTELLVGAQWARPERANCSRAPEPTRWPPWFWPALQRHATRYPPRSIAPSRPGSQQHRRQSSWWHAGGRNASRPGRCRPSRQRLPPASWSSACSSTASSRRPTSLPCGAPTSTTPPPPIPRRPAAPWPT